MTAPLTPGRLLGRFRLERKLALGGMAEIWSAVDTSAVDEPRPVALKVVLPELVRDREFRNMFWDELNIARRLQHVHVARVFEGFGEDGYLLLPERPGLGVEFNEELALQQPYKFWEPPHLHRQDGSYTNW